MTNSTIERLKRGCGRDACGVTVKNGYGEEDVDIIPCGCYCPYHKQIEYCEFCRAKLSQREDDEKEFEKMLDDLNNFRRPVSDKRELFDFKRKIYWKIEKLKKSLKQDKPEVEDEN